MRIFISNMARRLHFYSNHLNKIESEHLIDFQILADPKYIRYQIFRRISHAPEILQGFKGRTDLTQAALFQHLFDGQWMRLVANFEDIFVVDMAKTVVRRLQIVESLSHVSLRRKNYGIQTILGVRNLKKRYR